MQSTLVLVLLLPSVKGICDNPPNLTFRHCNFQDLTRAIFFFRLIFFFFSLQIIIISWTLCFYLFTFVPFCFDDWTYDLT